MRRHLRGIDPYDIEDEADRAHLRRHEDEWLVVDKDFQIEADKLVNERYRLGTAHRRRMSWVRFAAGCVSVTGVALWVIDPQRFAGTLDGVAGIFGLT